MLRQFFDDARRTSPGKLWQPRALLLLICAFIFYQHLRDPLYGGIVKGLNLAIHEIGHVFFGFFGDFIGIAGGTLLQLLAPLAAFWMFYRQRDHFAIAIAFCWLATNLFDVAAYAADARAGELPLVSIGGGDPEHDWFLMLAETGMLNHDRIIGGIFRGLGVSTFVVGLAFGCWVIMQMRKPNDGAI
ncbi:MAG TPA: hypothetical protein VM100_13805 [Longimicrobiales bacterium]|nr:hypothetical protein [Longimicrobiales bacterium]